MMGVEAIEDQRFVNGTYAYGAHACEEYARTKGHGYMPEFNGKLSLAAREIEELYIDGFPQVRRTSGMPPVYISKNGAAFQIPLEGGCMAIEDDLVK